MVKFTRDELKAKATELGITFNPREKSEKLLSMINELTGEENTFDSGAAKPPVEEDKQNNEGDLVDNSGAASTAEVFTPTDEQIAAYLANKAAEEKAALDEASAYDQGTTRCIIHSNDRENDEQMFEGNLNGEPVRVVLGEEIDFPNRYKTLIKGSTVETKEPILEEDGTPSGKYKDIRRPRYIIETV